MRHFGKPRLICIANAVCKNLGETHVSVLDTSNTEKKIVVANSEVCNGFAVWEVSHEERWSWASSGHGNTPANVQRFIKVNDTAEKWVVEAFARQKGIYAGKEMAEKKGTIGKCSRIQFEITIQKNNHCSNIKHVFQIRFLCVSVCIYKGEY